MAVDKISNLNIWQSFFSSAQPDMYRAFVHCKDPSCAAQVAGSYLTLVPTVPSYYCTDLVSPMNQLLSFALASDPTHSHPNDKFAFVSDSTLPAKPFASMHPALTNRQGSDFCLFPSEEWADIGSPTGISVAPKHHQWIVLDRAHSARATKLWATGYMHDLMAKFQMNSLRWVWGDNAFGDGRNFGCLDEFWHMTALFGAIDTISANEETSVSFPMFGGGPLRVARNTGWQGTCDTYVIWSKYLGQDGGAASSFQRLHKSLDPPSIPHGGNNQRPGWWDKMSTFGMRAIRLSDFLFVRKFIDNPTLTDGPNFAEAYVREVLV